MRRPTQKLYPLEPAVRAIAAVLAVVVATTLFMGLETLWAQAQVDAVQLSAATAGVMA